jgi:ketosteroid isomerase-like protein
MSDTENLRMVQDGYAAFLRGDLQKVLNDLADDVVWDSPYGAASHVPTAGVRHGKAAVADWFKVLAETCTFSNYEVRDYLAAGDKVVALGHCGGTSMTGATFETDFAHVFTLRNAKIVRYQDFTDSAQINAAFRAQQ